MISQPMNGKTESEIIETRNKFLEYAEKCGHEVVNTLFTDEWYSKESMDNRGIVNIPLQFLAKAIENMGLCHVVFFAKGWESSRGCRIEHDIAIAYGLEVIYD